MIIQYNRNGQKPQIGLEVADIPHASGKVDIVLCKMEAHLSACRASVRGKSDVEIILKGVDGKRRGR